MTGYKTNIEGKTLNNTYFRQVLYTAKNMQLVVMALQPNEDIGVEVHPNVDQFFRVEEGEGKVS
jgi:mannose-6-phosphate isomerase-like protein (cupin superfamily)